MPLRFRPFFLHINAPDAGLLQVLSTPQIGLEDRGNPNPA